MFVEHQESDFGTPETQSHGGGIRKGYTAENEKIAILLAGTHIAYLYNRGNINEQQAQAGDRFFSDALIAGKVPYSRSCCDRDIRCNTNDYFSERRIKSCLKLEEAMRLFTSKEYNVVFRVVIKGEAVGGIDTHWRRVKANMVELCSALDKLIKLYHI